MFGDLNFWALLGAAAIYFVLSMIWYSPKVFGRVWMEGACIKESDVQNCGIGVYIGSFVNAFIIAFVLAIFLYLTQSQTVLDAVVIAFLAWLGFVLTTHISGLLWGKTTLPVFFVNTCYTLVGLILMAIFLILV
jgi:hypothetical protein